LWTIVIARNKVMNFLLHCGGRYNGGGMVLQKSPEVFWGAYIEETKKIGSELKLYPIFITFFVFSHNDREAY